MSNEVNQSQSIEQCFELVQKLKSQPLDGLFPNDQNRVRWALRDLEMVFRPYIDDSKSNSRDE